VELAWIYVVRTRGGRRGQLLCLSVKKRRRKKRRGGGDPKNPETDRTDRTQGIQEGTDQASQVTATV
jgi:hypothetical protein